MIAHDVPSLLRSLAPLRIGTATTEEDTGAAMRILTAFNRCMLGLVRNEASTAVDPRLIF